MVLSLQGYLLDIHRFRNGFWRWFQKGATESWSRNLQPLSSYKDYSGIYGVLVPATGTTNSFLLYFSVLKLTMNLFLILVWFFCWKQVQEIVLSADMQCEKCQKRVADIIAKMNGKPLFYTECGFVCCSWLQNLDIFFMKLWSSIEKWMILQFLLRIDCLVLHMIEKLRISE